jgi:HlyD family secretion protein
MKPKLLIPIFLLIAAAIGGYFVWQYAPFYVRHDGSICVSGNIETTEVQIAFKIPGRVQKRFFDEGELVKQGDPVAELETADLLCEAAIREAEVKAAGEALLALKAGSRKEEIAAAKAAVQRAEAVLAELLAGSRPQEIAAAQAAVAAAAADLERLAADLARSTTLFQRKMISQEDIDQVRAAHEVAKEKHREAVERFDLVREGPRKEQIEQARHALAQAQAQCDLVVAGPRIEDIRAGEARLEQAQAALKLAKTRLDYARVFSPLKGVTLSKNIEPGEYVAPGTPVVTIGDMDHVWLRAYIEETDKGRVKPGQRAWLTTDAYPGKRYEGRVSFIADEAEFTPKNVQTQKQRVKLVYRIKIDLDNPSWELSPGMPADAEIETRD